LAEEGYSGNVRVVIDAEERGGSSGARVKYESGKNQEDQEVSIESSEAQRRKAALTWQLLQ
jgi:hypothetical protein